MSVQSDFGQQIPGTNLADVNSDPYAVGAKWTAHKDYKKPFDYFLEGSQQKLQLQRLEMPDLLKHGVASEMDFITKALVSSDAKSESPKSAIQSAIASSDSFKQMEKMVNAVCVAGILRPKVYPVPTVTRTENGQTTVEEVPQDKRQQGLFYVDQIPWDDRQELLSVIFETEGLSDFREEQADGVGNVANVQDVQLPADGPVADVPSDNT